MTRAVDQLLQQRFELLCFFSHPLFLLSFLRLLVFLQSGTLALFLGSFVIIRVTGTDLGSHTTGIKLSHPWILGQRRLFTTLLEHVVDD